MNYTYLLNKNPDIWFKARRKSFTEKEWQDFRVYRYCYLLLFKVSYNFISLMYISSLMIDNKDSFIVNIHDKTSDGKSIDDTLKLMLIDKENNFLYTYNVFELKKVGYLKEVKFYEDNNTFR